jgi:ribosomal protein L35AE/L33A
MEDKLIIKGEVVEIAGNRGIVAMHVAKQTGTEVLTKVVAEVEI